MIQGGDPQSKGAATGVMLGSGGPGYLIPAEIGKSILKVHWRLLELVALVIQIKSLLVHSFILFKEIL